MHIKSLLRLSTTMGASIALGLAVAGTSAQAATIRSVLSENIGIDSAPVSVGVNLDKIGSSIKFTVEVLEEPTTGNIGDLLGFFFDIRDDSLLSGLSITDELCTTASGSTFSNSTGSSPCISNVTFSASNVINFGGGNNLNPADPFDAGFTVGRAGLKGGADDIRNVMFTLTHSSTALSFDQFIKPDQRLGARLQSVGPEGGTRGGSGKVVGEVPTPAMLPGIVGIGLAAVRKRKRKAEVERA